MKYVSPFSLKIARQHQYTIRIECVFFAIELFDGILNHLVIFAEVIPIATELL